MNQQHSNDFKFFSWLIAPITGLILLLSLNVSAQQMPANIGFETGTFSGWAGATGHCCPIYTPWQGIDTAQHVITTGSFTDPHSNGLITAVAPGSLFSARLGNDSGHAESEQLDFSFTVPQDSLLLIIRFAVILENAHHPPVKQPRFRYKVSAPGLPTTACLEEQVTAGDSAYDFIYIGNYELLDWQWRVINLTGLTGTSINIHFETGDCEPGGHFGYSYVDGNLAPAGINSTSCNPDGSITLYVAPGLGGVWFDGSTSDSLIIPEPQAGEIYEYYIENDGGCFETFTYSVDEHFPKSNFAVHTDCSKSVAFDNLSVMDPGAVTTWEFGDGLVSNQPDPVHTYAALGTYEVILTVMNPDNCRSVSNQNFLLSEPPLAAFSVEDACAETEVKFVNNSTFPNGVNLEYAWYLDGNLIYTDPEPVHTFEIAGIHELMLVAISAGCTDTLISILDVSSPESCTEKYRFWFPNAFTPNGDGINDYFNAITADENLCTLTLYNRFGESVFSGKKWDGRQNGDYCPAGIYTYVFSCESSLNQEPARGTVMLIR